jgi:CHAT domain-containing protein
MACHAHADQAAPWRSSLELADRPVDIGELLTLRRSTRLDIETVCLAGCSTNVAGADHDETFSLASTFLAAGARTAFGSMWTVPDDHTSRLMFMVHHFLARGEDPAEALNHAQRWAADPARVPPPGMPAALARAATGADDPIAWAGFQHVGA